MVPRSLCTHRESQRINYSRGFPPKTTLRCFCPGDSFLIKEMKEVYLVLSNADLSAVLNGERIRLVKIIIVIG